MDLTWSTAAAGSASAAFRAFLWAAVLGGATLRGKSAFVTFYRVANPVLAAHSRPPLAAILTPAGAPACRPRNVRVAELVLMLGQSPLEVFEPGCVLRLLRQIVELPGVAGKVEQLVAPRAFTANCSNRASPSARPASASTCRATASRLRRPGGGCWRMPACHPANAAVFTDGIRHGLFLSQIPPAAHAGGGCRLNGRSMPPSRAP